MNIIGGTVKNRFCTYCQSVEVCHAVLQIIVVRLHIDCSSHGAVGVSDCVICPSDESSAFVACFNLFPVFDPSVENAVHKVCDTAFILADQTAMCAVERFRRVNRDDAVTYNMYAADAVGEVC